MKIEYICHACLVIETDDARIVTDPWFAAPAYCDKWYVFPKPVRTDFVNEVDTILISHGHEDHLNEPTLKLFPKNAKVFYPYSFFGGAKEYIESMGFADVRECVTYRKYDISKNTSVTFVINSHDSIMVIESGGEVLVNANDALHSSPEKVIDFYTAALSEKWPKIDYLFCGFGGASYFPNTMHLAGKDDHATSLVREQLFAHNFCRVVKGLKPTVAVPFAADFCLLDNDQRWINEARFPRSKMSQYYREYFGEDNYDPKIIDMYSGDHLEKGDLTAASPYRMQMQNGVLDHLIDEQYGDEILAKRNQKKIPESEAEKLADEIRLNIEKRRSLFSDEKLNGLVFSVCLTDVAQNSFYNISFQKGNVKICRAEASDDDSLLTMEMSSDIVRYSIGSDWGADVISIGSGAEIYISDKRAAEVDLEKICMNLLACYPTPSDLRKTPFRTLQFLLLNPPRFTTSIRKLKKFNIESENYDRKTWLLKKPEEIRRIYGLPTLESEFFAGG
ncbi:MAG: MBL fold metallo-hydrolase [Pyrinomonadaceae bacterium]